jgi:hypothetical protein
MAKMKPLTFLLILISTVVIGFLIFWLWQRQPKSININSSEKTSTTIEKKDYEKNSSIFVLDPKDNDILDTSTIKFSGKTNKDNKIILISNTIGDIANVKNDGTFEITEVLENGLNLINIISIDRDFKEIQKESLTLYVSTSSDKDKNVTAGFVNKIFENTLTVTTPSGDVTVKKTISTTISTPKPDVTKPIPSPKNKDADIRVGDYIVALGAMTKETGMTASSIQIIRDNKPQITKKYAPVKFASAAKLKIFSGYDLGDNKLIEFKLDKTTVFAGDKKSDEKAIAKDKRAIIFYTPSGSDNIASLIYILP